MNSASRTIVKNASVMMFSQVITWGLALCLTIFLPRYLGVAAVGQLQLATSLWAILDIFVAFGTNILLTKEISRSPEMIAELFGTAVVLRAALFLVAVGLMALYVRIAHYEPATVQVIYVVGVAAFIGEFTGACQSVLQGLERMEYMSLSDILSKAFSTIVSIILLLMGCGVLFIALVMIGGALVSFSIQFFALRRIRRLRFHFNWRQAAWMLKAGFPYLIAYVFLTLYMQVDVVIISLLVDEKGVGWYSAAQRLFGSFLFVPTIFMTAVFPALSRMYANDSQSLPKLIGRSFDLLLMAGVPVGLGLTVIARPLVVLLFGQEFANSGPVLAVMGIALILTYLNILFGQYLISTDRQNVWTRVMAVATVVTFPLDLVLVPWCQKMFANGALAGAITSLITETGMAVAGLWLLSKEVFRGGSAWTAARVLFAGLVMAAAAYLLRDLFIVIPVAAGVGMYAGLILLLRVLPAEELAALYNLTKGLFGRLYGPRPQQASLNGKSTS